MTLFATEMDRHIPTHVLQNAKGWKIIDLACAIQNVNVLTDTDLFAEPTGSLTQISV